MSSLLLNGGSIYKVLHDRTSLWIDSKSVKERFYKYLINKNDAEDILLTYSSHMENWLKLPDAPRQLTEYSQENHLTFYSSFYEPYLNRNSQNFLNEYELIVEIEIIEEDYVVVKSSYGVFYLDLAGEDLFNKSFFLEEVDEQLGLTYKSYQEILNSKEELLHKSLTIFFRDTLIIKSSDYRKMVQESLGLIRDLNVVYKQIDHPEIQLF